MEPIGTSLYRCTCSNIQNMATLAENKPTNVGMRELSQRTAQVLARVRAGEIVEITDRGKPVARIVPATADRYDQLIAAGIIQQAKRPFDVADLPELGSNLTGRPSEQWLTELRGGH